MPTSKFGTPQFNELYKSYEASGLTLEPFKITLNQFKMAKQVNLHWYQRWLTDTQNSIKRATSEDLNYTRTEAGEHYSWPAWLRTKRRGNGRIHRTKIQAFGQVHGKWSQRAYSRR